MASIIDALVVELSLDTTKFSEGQKKAVDSLRALEQGAQKHMDPVQKGFDNIVGTMKELQGRLLAVGALIAAGLGFNRLTQEVTKANTELGYLSKTLGISAQDLSAWENAGRTVGATADEMKGSIAAVNAQLQEFHATGRSELSALMGRDKASGGLGIKPMQPGDTADTVLKRLSEWYVRQPDKAFAAHLLQTRGGISQGMINLLSLGPEELQKRLDYAKRFAPTNEEIAQFTKLTEAFGNLLTVINKLTIEALTPFIGALTKILEQLTSWLGRWAQGENPADVAGSAAAKLGMPELAPNPAKPSLASRGWNWLKGRFGGGATSQPSGANDNAPASFNDRFKALSGGGSGGGTGFGMADRSRAYAELEANPALKQRFFAHVLGENKNPEAIQALMEEAANRYSLRKSIAGDQGFAGHGNLSYFQGYDPGAVSRYQKILEEKYHKVFVEGSNISQGAIDNSSSWLLAKHRRTGAFNETIPSINGEGFQRPGTQESFRGERANYDAWLAAQAPRSQSEPARAGMPSSLPSTGGKTFQLWKDLGLDKKSAPTFDELWNNRIGIGSKGALIRGGDSSSTTNSNTSMTNIHSMNVTVPRGADPSAYADGIQRRLSDYNNVQNANTGLV
jgi:hypothetical protein